MRRLPQKYLFGLWFYVNVGKMSFETAKVNLSIEADLTHYVGGNYVDHNELTKKENEEAVVGYGAEKDDVGFDGAFYDDSGDNYRSFRYGEYQEKHPLRASKSEFIVNKKRDVPFNWTATTLDRNHFHGGIQKNNHKNNYLFKPFGGSRNKIINSNQQFFHKENANEKIRRGKFFNDKNNNIRLFPESANAASYFNQHYNRKGHRTAKQKYNDPNKNNEEQKGNIIHDVKYVENFLKIEYTCPTLASCADCQEAVLVSKAAKEGLMSVLGCWRSD